MHDPWDDERLLADVDALLGPGEAEAGPGLPLEVERALWREAADAAGLPLSCSRRDCRRARRCVGPLGRIERAPSCTIDDDEARLGALFAEARERRAVRLRRGRSGAALTLA